MDSQEALDKIYDLRALIDENAASLSSDGEDYLTSVDETLKGIGETISRTGRCSDGQETAIENIEAGVRKWLPEDIY